MDSLFSFLDYRLYLKKFYQTGKTGERGFIFRRMAGRMGFTSSNFLILVMQGKRNLGKAGLAKVIKGLDLRGRKAEYFSYLVFFNQAVNPVEKNYYYGLLAAYRSRLPVARLDAAKFEYYNRWYIPVLREIAKGLPVGDLDWKEVAGRVSPPIPPREARRSLELLKDLGLLRADARGRLAQSSDLVDTGAEVQSLAVRNFHKSMADLARDSIDRVDPPAREISSLTVRISGRGFAKIKTRLQSFRKELLHMVREDKDDDRVYQLNFQFFPVSRIPLEEP